MINVFDKWLKTLNDEQKKINKMKIVKLISNKP